MGPDERDNQEDMLRLVELKADLQRTMAALSPQERRLIELFYGLTEGDGRPLTIAEILDELENR